jgi:calcium-dependent protein kinase
MPSAFILKQPSSSFLERDYEVLHLLGKGGFGHVHLLRERTTGQERVCKSVSTAGMSIEDLQQMREEVNVLRRLEHPSIVKLHEHTEDKSSNQLLIILEYIPGGSCRSLLKKQGGKPLLEVQVAHFMSDVFDALVHCHTRGVIHRDLKPDHMMLTGTLDGRPKCTIIDFGLSVSCCDANSMHMLHTELMKRVGTPAYMAPEVVDRDVSCTSKADVWSAAVSALVLVTGSNPFSCEDEVLTFKVIGRFEDLDDLVAARGDLQAWRSLKPAAKAFLHSLLKTAPSDRLSAVQALQHLWITEPRNVEEANRLPELSAKSFQTRRISRGRTSSPRQCPQMLDSGYAQVESSWECVSSRAEAPGMPNSARVTCASRESSARSKYADQEKRAGGWPFDATYTRRFTQRRAFSCSRQEHATKFCSSTHGF